MTHAIHIDLYYEILRDPVIVTSKAITGATMWTGIVAAPWSLYHFITTLL